MNAISIDWRHISAIIVALLLVATFLVLRSAPQATYSESVPAGSSASVDNDDPKAPAQGALTPMPVQ